MPDSFVPLLAAVKLHVLMGGLGDEGGMCSTSAIRLEPLGKHYVNRVCAVHLALVLHRALYQVKLASVSDTSS